jgi:hypothetical protein
MSKPAEPDMAAFEAAMRAFGWPERLFGDDLKPHEKDIVDAAYTGWDAARAALAEHDAAPQPQLPTSCAVVDYSTIKSQPFTQLMSDSVTVNPAQPDRRDLIAPHTTSMRSTRLRRFNPTPNGKAIDDDDFVYDALLRISGDFPDEAVRLSYAQWLCDKLNAAPPAQPVPVEKLLEWAVLDGVIRMSKVFDPDLQDALEKFAARFAAPPAQPVAQPLSDPQAGYCRRCGGSGDMWAHEGHGPDQHAVQVNCDQCGGTGAAQPVALTTDTERTDALISAAEERAALYEGDERQDIKTDVMNAFFAGAKFAAGSKT